MQLVHFTHAFITHMPKEKLCSELCYWLKYSTEILVWKDAANVAHRFLLTIFQSLKHMSPNTLYQSVTLAFTQTGICHLKMESKKYSSKLHKIMDCTSSLYLHFSKLPLLIFWITLKHIPISASPGWRLWMWLCKKE